jgi:hypothetical protein
VLGGADDGRAVGLADNFDGVGGGALSVVSLLLESFGEGWDLPEKGFCRRMVNSPEGGGAIERGIVM